MIDIYSLTDDELLLLKRRINEAEHRRAVETEKAVRQTCTVCLKRHAPKDGGPCGRCRRERREQRDARRAANHAGNMSCAR